MGEIAKRLYQRLAAKAHTLPTTETKRKPGELLPGGIKPLETLIKEGHDPFHAIYVFMQNLTAHFAEIVSGLPEMASWAKAVAKAEHEYMPSGPPMSSLSRSFFWMWALYDLRIGKSHDTVVECQIAANDVIWMNEHQLKAAKNMSVSWMGIYENAGMDGPHVLLRELITNERFLIHCPTGYRGHTGELWYVRLLPPLEPQITRKWIAMTTPYILLDASKADWVAFLRRTMLECKGSDEAARLRNLLKFGLGPNYWNEFVFKAYHHYQQDAVFLTGIPDLKATLPHA
jgi:hypothetical protein